MKTTLYVAIMMLILVQLPFCSESQELTKNKPFLQNLNAYLKYADSVDYRSDFDYIIIDALVKSDTTYFTLYMAGGAYYIIYNQGRFVDYFEYNNHKILLFGNCPNDIIKIPQNNSINIIEDIVKVNYHKDYERYQRNPDLVQPVLSDFMEMALIFYKDEFISCTRKYY